MPTEKKSKKFLYIIISLIVVAIILWWAGLTKAGYLDNYFNIEILTSQKELNQLRIENEFCVGDPLSCPLGKPVIYLYPKEKQDINVKLNLKGALTVSYPQYKDGWNVFAYPDGKILNHADGKEYSYLFWEGNDKDAKYDLSNGFIVKGSETVNFLQSHLAAIGLTPKEYNEFIVYWLPQMQDNNYNLIHFATKNEYEDRAALDINPKPDSILRVFMVFKGIDKEIKVNPQEIKPFARNGFTVVEWGATNLNPGLLNVNKN